MTSETQQLFTLGKQCFERKDYTRAEQCFLKILRDGSQYADILNMLGIIYHVEGKFNNAIESFEEALKINPNYTEATLNLAVLYNDVGEYKKAKELYTRIRKKKISSDLDPILKGKIANMHAALGDTYRGVGKYEAAIDEYEKALKLCPSYVDIRTKLGIAYRENGQKPLSVKELSVVLRQDSAYEAARLQLGVTYYSMGQKGKAATSWRKILKKNGDHEVARIYLRLCENGASRSPAKAKLG